MSTRPSKKPILKIKNKHLWEFEQKYLYNHLYSDSSDEKNGEDLYQSGGSCGSDWGSCGKPGLITEKDRKTALKRRLFREKLYLTRRNEDEYLFDRRENLFKKPVGESTENLPDCEEVSSGSGKGKSYFEGRHEARSTERAEEEQNLPGSPLERVTKSGSVPKSGRDTKHQLRGSNVTTGSTDFNGGFRPTSTASVLLRHLGASDGDEDGDNDDWITKSVNQFMATGSIIT